MTRRLTAATAVAAAMALAAAGGAQEARFAGTLEVNTINVDVMVTDGGRPVTGLTREDFEILEDGHPVTITNFARVVEGTVYREGAAGPIADTQDYRFRRHVVLLFDLNFTERPWVARAVDTAKRFIHERGGDDVDWSVAVVGAEAEILLPFTSDTGKVLGVLDAILDRPTYRRLHEIDRSLFADPLRLAVTSNEMPANRLLETTGDADGLIQFAMREQGQRSLLAYMVMARGLTDIFRAYASLPGKKAAIVFVGNMDLSLTPGHIADSRPDTFPIRLRRGFDPIQASILDRINQVWEAVIQLANGAGFRIYVGNVMGLDNPFTYQDAESRFAGMARPSDAQADWETLPRMLADGTGGRYFNANSVAPALRTADEELKTYYSLAYRAPHGHDNRYHEIRVKVRRRGVHLRYRRGYLDLDRGSQVALQLASPASFPKVGGDLPMAVQVDAHRVGDRLELAATAVAPVKRLALVPEGDRYVGDIEVWLAVYGPDGEVLDVTRHEQRLEVPSDRLEDAQRAPFRYTVRFDLPVERYTVAMAVVDRVGGITGIANAPVEPQGL